MPRVGHKVIKCVPIFLFLEEMLQRNVVLVTLLETKPKPKPNLQVLKKM
jgi:hypothetical protein